MGRFSFLSSAMLSSWLLAIGLVPNAFGAISKPISFSILEDYDKGDDLAQVEADFHLMQDLGVRTWRGSFGWDDYEPEPGVYDFAWLKQFIELAARNQITLRPYVGYTPAMAARQNGSDQAPWNNPPARIEDWYQFVFRLASATKEDRNVLSFEIYNEENAPLWWDGSAADYRKVLEYGSKAVRKAQGNDQVLLGGMTYPDLAWVEQVCSAGLGTSFDILPIHAYPETWTEENIDVENFLDLDSKGSFQNSFLPSADEACGKKPVWLNEVGFATTPSKHTERDQATWWVRAFATFIANPRIQHIGIYEIKDQRPSAAVIGESENYYLGLTYPDRTKKLAFYTIKRLINLFDTGTIAVADEEISVETTEGKAGEPYHHLFIRPDGRQVLIVWDKRASPVLRIQLKRKGSRVTEYALNGTGAPYPEFDGKHLLNIRLSTGEPRIFEIFP